MQGQGPPPGYNQPTNNPPTNNPPMNGAMNGGMNQGHHGRGPPPMYGQAPPPYPAAAASQQHHGQGGPLGYAYLGGPSQQPPSAAPSGSAMHNNGYGGPPPQYAQQPQPVQAQQAAAPPKQDTPKAQIETGSLCWYRDTDGSAKKVEVVSVDRSMIPPSYVIRIDGRDRETEVPFLSRARGGKGLGRAASGGALAPELPRATRIQPESDFVPFCAKKNLAHIFKSVLGFCWNVPGFLVGVSDFSWEVCQIWEVPRGLLILVSRSLLCSGSCPFSPPKMRFFLRIFPSFFVM